MCVDDFAIKQGEPGLSLELNSGTTVWKPVTVMKPTSISSEANFVNQSVLSVKELADFDEIEFQSHAVTDEPGILCKGSSTV